MKFKIRFADQIVGFFIIVALLALVAVIFLLGSSQRWFSKDFQYVTYFESASGLSVNMAVQHKGFTIGNVKSFKLNDGDQVEVVFSIHHEYGNRVREGSLVDLDVSPIGLGNHFYFYPGLGDTQLAEGDFVPSVTSPKGRSLIQMGLANAPVKNDSISNLIAQVDALLVSINDSITGTDATSLGRTLGGVEETISNINGLTGNINTSLGPILADVNANLGPILADIKRITSDLEQLTGKLDEPGGVVAAAFGPDQEIYANLEASLKSVSGILRNLEKTTDYLPPEMPQILGLVAEVRTTLGTVEDVLTALLNNPFLKNGVPRQVNTQSNGTSPRGIQF
jgi:phospholipid/cholesterol/gamma-HCH transport system substrate-binding protein